MKLKKENQTTKKDKSRLSLRRMRQAALFMATLPFLLFMTESCESISCPLNTTVECVYGFYASARPVGGSFVAGTAITVTDTISIVAMGPDSVLANRLCNQTGFKIPVSYFGDIDSLLLICVDTNMQVAYDTLWVTKINKPHLDDPSCPLHMWHTITNISSTHNLIDSILINNADINYDGLENLQIYFRVDSE